MAKRPPKKPKIDPIRVNPVSLNESILESNIASEIAALFNSRFNFGYPQRLRWLFDIDRINIAAFKKRRTKLFRLTPIEENRGGGWDTKISIPAGNGERRAIFIQFKSGTHSDGNEIKDSIFNLSLKNPNPHATFTFNDNSNNNQHQTLKKLSDYLVAQGLPSKSVMYGFPRITNLDDFDKLEDELILHTTFLTIEEIDKEAKETKANLYDGKPHNFRTCYISENLREISSDTFTLKNKSLHEDILYEILLVKLAHFRNQLVENVSFRYLNDELFFMLAEYLKINPIDSIEIEKYYPASVHENIIRYFKQLAIQNENNFYEIFKRTDSNDSPFAWRQRLFTRIVDFFNSKPEGFINIQTDIPTQFTFNIIEDLEIQIDSNVSLLIF